MNEAQKAAGLAALQAWAEPQIAAASIFERGAIKAYLDQHAEALVEVIGPAVLAVAINQPDGGSNDASA
jgi:hypothetical protein